MSGIGHDGGSPWGWCHRYTEPYCSFTGQTRRRFERLGLSWYGIETLTPSGPHSHPWYGQVTQSPSTLPPWPMWAPRCGQCACSTCSSPSSPR